MKTINEQMQEILPGSTTFPARVLCPRCGWHFKAGLTDPSGKHRELMPGGALVCGQCLAILKVNEARELEKISAEELRQAKPEDMQLLAQVWMATYVGRALAGPDAEAEPTGKPQ
jgi:hypothetical protein